MIIFSESSVGNTITDIINDLNSDPHRPLSPEKKLRIGVDVATGMGLQVGIITFALGLFRLGFLDVVLSRALLRGFSACSNSASFEV